MEEKKPFPWNGTAVGLLSLKGSDCCEAALFPPRLRAAAGGGIVNAAGKSESGLSAEVRASLCSEQPASGGAGVGASSFIRRPTRP